MKFIAVFAIVGALITQPILAHAEIQDPAIEMTSMTPSQLKNKVLAMSPAERREAAEAYRTYLANLDKALKAAERSKEISSGGSIEVTLSKAGIRFLIGGVALAIPTFAMTRSTMVLVCWTGWMVRRGAAAVVGIGGLLLGAAGLMAESKLVLNAIQIHKLRGTIVHLQQQLVEIEQLSD